MWSVSRRCLSQTSSPQAKVGSAVVREAVPGILSVEKA